MYESIHINSADKTACTYNFNNAQASHLSCAEVGSRTPQIWNQLSECINGTFPNSMEWRVPSPAFRDPSKKRHEGTKLNLRPWSNDCGIR